LGMVATAVCWRASKSIPCPTGRPWCLPGQLQTAGSTQNRNGGRPRCGLKEPQPPIVPVRRPGPQVSAGYTPKHIPPHCPKGDGKLMMVSDILNRPPRAPVQRAEQVRPQLRQLGEVYRVRRASSCGVKAFLNRTASLWVDVPYRGDNCGRLGGL
jgi:hypothetical protein